MITETDISTNGTVRGYPTGGRYWLSYTKKERTKTTHKWKDVLSFRLTRGYYPLYPYSTFDYRIRRKPCAYGGYQYKWNKEPPGYEWKGASYDKYVGGGVTSSFKNYNSCIEQASARLAKKVKGQKVDTITAVAEATKSIDMVLSHATTIFSSLKSLYRLDIKGAFQAFGMKPTSREKYYRKQARRLNQKARHLGKDLNGRDFRTVRGLPESWYAKASQLVSNAWLSIRYGYTPLLLDIDGAMQFLAEPPKLSIMRASAGSKAKSTEVVNTVATRNLTNYSGNLAYTVYYEVNPSYPTYNPSLGLDIKDIPNTMYELVPGSFLLDWFLPIGDYLKTFSAYAGVKFKAGCLSVKTINTGYAMVRSDKAIYGYKALGVIRTKRSRSARSKYRGFTRSIIKDFPGVAIPSFEVMDSYKPNRVLDLFALATSAVHGRKTTKIRF